MANICENKFIFSNEGNDEEYKRIKHILIEDIGWEHGNEFDGEITYEDECFIEGWFESRWVFPSEYFEKLIPEDIEGIDFRCLSEEYGCGYVAMNIYRDGSWWDEQTFDL